jgi:hypothetical protein
MWKALLSGISFALALSGCSIGPQVKDRIVFIKHDGVAARVTKNVTVPLEVEKDGQAYTEEKDIGGFYVISPDLKEKKAEEKK